MDSAACVCAKINTRHCPVHGQGETTTACICGECGDGHRCADFIVTADEGTSYCPRCESNANARDNEGIEVPWLPR